MIALITAASPGSRIFEPRLHLSPIRVARRKVSQRLDRPVRLANQAHQTASVGTPCFSRSPVPSLAYPPLAAAFQRVLAPCGDPRAPALAPPAGAPSLPSR